jgi:putative glutamine amidotransferase
MVKDYNALVLAKGEGYEVPFQLLGWNVKCIDTYERSPTMEEIEWASIMLFCGGEDVTTYLYGERPEGDWYFNAARDMNEVRAYMLAMYTELPVIGICRGSQFLRVMAGGSLVQDVRGHGLTGTHGVAATDEYVYRLNADEVWAASDDEEIPITFDVTSTHHQAAKFSDNGPSTMMFLDLLHSTQDEDDVAEGWLAILPDDTYIAGVQYHPEYMDSDSEGMAFFQDLALFVMTRGAVTGRSFGFYV